MDILKILVVKVIISQTISRTFYQSAFEYPDVKKVLITYKKKTISFGRFLILCNIMNN